MSPQFAKGPNMLNLNAYTEGQEEYEESEEQNNSQRPQIQNSKSIQEQFDNFIKQLNKYDEILNNVAQDLDDIALADNQFLTDFYPTFALNTTYQNDQQKKVITSQDPQLVKVLTNLQKTNKSLKQQMKGWSFQFAKKASLSETLISENDILRKAICKKNEELLKLISTIQNSQNDQISQMKENLQILRQQNGLLVEHMNKIKQQLNYQKQDCKKVEKALQEKRNELIQIQKQNREIEDKEQHLSKSAALLQDNLQQILKRKKKLQKQKERLILLKQNYFKDQQGIEQQVDYCEKQRSLIEQELKRKFELHQAEKHKLIEQIEDLTDKIQKQKQGTRNVQNQIERNSNRVQQFNRINRDLKLKNQQNVQIITKLKSQKSKSISQQGALQSQIYLLSSDISNLKNEMKELQQIQKQLEQKNKQTLKQQDSKNMNVLTQQRNFQGKQSKQLLKKIFEQNLVLSLRQKEIKDWGMKIEQKREEMSDLKSQIKEVRNNQIKLSEIKSKLAQGVDRLDIMAYQLTI